MAKITETMVAYRNVDGSHSEVSSKCAELEENMAKRAKSRRGEANQYEQPIYLSDSKQHTLRSDQPPQRSNVLRRSALNSTRFPTASMT